MAHAWTASGHPVSRPRGVIVTRMVRARRHGGPRPQAAQLSVVLIRRLHSSIGWPERLAPQPAAPPPQAVHHGEGQQCGMERRVETGRRTESTNHGQHKPHQCPTPSLPLCHDPFRWASDPSSQASRQREPLSTLRRLFFIGFARRQASVNSLYFSWML